NPTLNILEKKVAALEHCDRAKIFGSGMAAISAAIMSCVKTGAHVVCVDTCYGPTKQFLRDYLPKFGVSVTFIEGCDPEHVIDAFETNTTLLYLESPSSILFMVQDLETLCTAAHERGIKVAIDNSYSSPIFQTPADFGVDIVLHSATKYLSGHSDVVAGALACSQEHFSAMLDNEISLFGGAIAPLPAWLMLRGLRTLPIRMKAHQEAGNIVANWLRIQPRVVRVNHIGFEEHPQREWIQKQMSGSAGLVSFELDEPGLEPVRKFLDALKVFQMGVSWGGFESLAVPVEMHPIGWSEPRIVIRLYCGLEAPEDLLEDLAQALTS
ncbi:MAG: aminotransferase class I/II-fold pyridoxal phosphate-dependent enzyme, partial [Armatimonadetes bacterium]|nr:aminotransferase class I/II-fold pyridoxal phosphate-dependent enzyme [Armatimonadota bacterium]